MIQVLKNSGEEKSPRIFLDNNLPDRRRCPCLLHLLSVSDSFQRMIMCWISPSRDYLPFKRLLNIYLNLLHNYLPELHPVSKLIDELQHHLKMFPHHELPLCLPRKEDRRTHCPESNK